MVREGSSGGVVVARGVEDDERIAKVAGEHGSYPMWPAYWHDGANDVRDLLQCDRDEARALVREWMDAGLDVGEQIVILSARMNDREDRPAPSLA